MSTSGGGTVALVLFVLVNAGGAGVVGVTAGGATDLDATVTAPNADTHEVEPGDSIQTAVDAASPGDRVVLHTGTFEQRVRIGKDITLIAPDGAVLDGSTLAGDGAAVTIRQNAAPTIAGITIKGYPVGVSAEGATGDWVLRNVTVTGVPRGVEASRSTGDWVVRRSTIHRANNGLMAVGSTGEWVISNTTISEYGDDAVGAFASEGAWVMRDNVFRDSRGDGCSSNAVGAENTTGRWSIVDTRILNSTCAGVATWHASGDWTIRNATITDAQFGVGTRFATGDWTVVATTIERTDVGVWAPRTEGNWTLRDVTVRESGGGVSARGATGDWSINSTTLAGYGERPGVDATDTTGRWRITNTSFLGDGSPDLDATGASPGGTATGNWWGGDDPDCIGSVNCASPLAAPPGETPTSTATPTQTGTPTPSADTDSSRSTVASETPTSTTSPGLSVPAALAALATLGAVLLASCRRKE